MKKKYLIIGAILLILAGSYFYFTIKRDAQAGNSSLAGPSAVATPVFGTRTGSSTPVGQGFYGSGTAASTTKVIYIGNETDEATFAIRILTASATPNGYFDYTIFGSNDLGCNTATTTSTTGNYYVLGDILWNSLSTAVSGRITATFANATGTSIFLDDLNWRCLRMDATGSSTSVWVTAVLKE